jgi:hypothetical protein
VSSVAGYSPVSNDVKRAAEESPLLEIVTRERLLETQQAGKSLVGAVVIYNVDITCSSEWCAEVVNKSNSEIQTPSIVTPKYVTISKRHLGGSVRNSV